MSARSRNELYDAEYGPQYRDKGPFPSVDDQIEKLNLGSDDATSESGDDDIKVVEEIESMCMKCEQNVCLSSCGSLPASDIEYCAHLGYHSTTFDQDPILSGDHLDVILL